MRRVAVFFYGLFMDADLLRQQGMEPAAPRRAEVRGMALRIGSRATLVLSADSTAHGIVMDLTHQEIDRLYSDSSVAAYRPEAVLARLADESVAALCFNLPQPPAAHETNRDYARKLAEIGRKVGLPPAYVASLE